MNDRPSKAKGLMWIVVAGLTGMCLAVGLAPLAHIIPFQWEKPISYALGAHFPQSECVSNEKAHALLGQLVRRLYPAYTDDADFSIDVHIVKNAGVNAFAELGGDIYVYSGLLAQAESPEELAGVLAHEMEHVHRRHILQGVLTHMFTAGAISAFFSGNGGSAANWAQYSLNMSFTRLQEEQADEGGLERLQKTHIDNQGFQHFFERMEKSESAVAFISDHPASGDRLQMAKSFANTNTQPIMSAAEWNIVKNYCSMER